ncbi:membrane-associated phospholipid phosphatase [Chryseobacterium sp. H1D6B]|uniref:phosphatase PAP2 family protein n=1 Tax=Chryseobacterium sp. H1D6B TaxID=2940588 RepID=UPI0015C9C5B4|nr:phosphatase PAP2 family protein [Chryseobacterium sp. H1D6B]MDH6252412.1 membrane-associated phospholipid phosphatase [Chryseobacterium sp. H1D6B]
MGTNRVKKNNRINFGITGLLLLTFILFTATILTVDVLPIGPEQSVVGLASLNKSVHDFFGINWYWYNITEWLGIIAIGVSVGFSIFGLVQFIKKRSFKKIDSGIIVLGAFYVLAFCFYALFEIVIINYRPIIINGSLEASFPSSHTMIIICIMATAIIQFNVLLKNRKIQIAANLISSLIIVITIIGRTVSGVHWFTDIVGGSLLGSALVMLYYSVLKYIDYRKCTVDK